MNPRPTLPPRTDVSILTSHAGNRTVTVNHQDDWSCAAQKSDPPRLASRRAIIQDSCCFGSHVRRVTAANSYIRLYPQITSFRWADTPISPWLGDFELCLSADRRRRPIRNYHPAAGCVIRPRPRPPMNFLDAATSDSQTRQTNISPFAQGGSRKFTR